MSFHFRDGSGNRYDVFTENEYITNGFGGALLIILLIGFFMSSFFGGLSDVYRCCTNVMIWTLIIVGVLVAFFIVVSLAKDWHPAIVPVIIGVLSAVTQSIIMINIIDAKTSLNFFNVLGALIVAIVEAFLAVVAGIIVGFITAAIISISKENNKEDNS